MLARVFPRKTNASPDDPLAFFGPPDLEHMCMGIKRVEVSVTYTYDLQQAEWLAKLWGTVAPTTIGGPATGMRGEDFEPGRYLKHGCVITSRGCPNKCWFCSVWKRDGTTRELPIRDGWNVMDDNLLACSDAHIKAVFAMLARQPEKPRFTGGLEAKILKPWHCAALRALKPATMYFAYDTPDDYEPLVEARKMLLAAGFPKKGHSMSAYCLIGWPKDTMAAAEVRLRQCYAAGFLPYAMLWRDKNGERDPSWQKFQRQWCRPVMVACMLKAAVTLPSPGGVGDEGMSGERR